MPKHVLGDTLPIEQMIAFRHDRVFGLVKTSTFRVVPADVLQLDGTYSVVTESADSFLLGLYVL
jgi:hypothetical protein